MTSSQARTSWTSAAAPVPVFAALDLRESTGTTARAIGVAGGLDYRSQFRRVVLRARPVLELQELRRPLGGRARRRRFPDADGDRQQRLDGCVAAESAAQRADRQRVRRRASTRWDRFCSTTSCPARTHARTGSIRQRQLHRTRQRRLRRGRQRSNFPKFTVLNGVDVYDPSTFTMSSFTHRQRAHRAARLLGAANVDRSLYTTRPPAGRRAVRRQDSGCAQDQRVDDPAYMPTGAPALTMNMALGTVREPGLLLRPLHARARSPI